MAESKRYRIWVQGATDRVHMAPYLAKLEPHLRACVDPAFSIDFHTTTPPATTTHALTEFRIARAVIRGAVEAERAGYDCFTINHFQDAGLAEAKSVVDIPVLGLGETTLLHACTMGRKLGLVTINPSFIPWHEDQIVRYGLDRRVAGVRAVDATVAVDSYEWRHPQGQPLAHSANATEIIETPERTDWRHYRIRNVCSARQRQSRLPRRDILGANPLANRARRQLGLGRPGKK